MLQLPRLMKRFLQPQGTSNPKRERHPVNNLGTEQVLHQQMESFQGTRQRQAPSRRNPGGQATAPEASDKGYLAQVPILCLPRQQEPRTTDHKHAIGSKRNMADWAKGAWPLWDQAAKVGASLRRMTVTCLLSSSAQRIISQVSGSSLINQSGLKLCFPLISPAQAVGIRESLPGLKNRVSPVLMLGLRLLLPTALRGFIKF